MESIKDIIKQVLESLYYKIKDSTVYNTLLEKYENLDQHHQRWIKKGVFAFIGLALATFFLTVFFSSIQKTEEFKIKKNLVNQMIQNPVSVGIKNSLTAIAWNEKINRWIDELSLSSEQSVKVSPYHPSQTQILEEFKDLTHIGKKIQIEGLNIQEVVDIGYTLDQMDSSVKLIRLQIEQTPFLSRYFKATYFVFLFFNPPSNR